MWYIIEAVNVVAEITIVFLYFSKLLISKYKNKYLYAVAYIISAMILYLTGIITSNSTVLISVTFIILLVTSNIMYQGAVTKKVFLSLLFIVIVFISEILFIGTMTALDIGLPSEIVQPGIKRVIGMIGTKIIYFWIVIIVIRLINKKIKEVPIKHWIMIFLMPVVSTLVLYIIFYSLMNSSAKDGMIIYCIAVLGLMYMNFEMFDFFETYQKQIRLTALEQLVAFENKNYKLIEKSYSDMRKLKHDISNQVNVINDLIKHDDKKSAELVLKGIYESIDNAGAVCFTGEPIIDSIINIKIKEACTYGIKVTSRINIKYFNIDSVEICRILGNALDNAIEGCQRSENHEPNIHISIQQIENKIAVEVSNSSCDVDLNNLHTSKFDKALHGIGIESMKTSVERLNGFMNQGCENGIFFLKMVLPNK